MQKFVCTCHDLVFEIPDNDQEFYDDHLHEQILSCKEHLNQFPDCVLVCE
jgi:hypothetical protein